MTNRDEPARVVWFSGIAIGMLVLICLAPVRTEAARFHVQPGGLRTAGASVAGDWSAENCYAALAAAISHAASQDTLLLDDAVHAYDAARPLPRLLANRSLDSDPSACEVVCGPEAGFTTQGGATDPEIRGIRFRGGGEAASLALLSVTVNGGLPQSLRILGCEFLDLISAYSGEPGGGVLQAAGNGGGMSLEILDSLFQGNECQGLGGALYVAAGYDVDIRTTDFVDNASLNSLNSSGGRGGAIAVAAIEAHSTLRLEECRLEGNRATGPGGAISMEQGSMVLVDTQILDSRSAWQGSSEWAAGVGIFMRTRTSGHMDPLTLEIRGCSFVGNHADLSVGSYAGDGGGCLVKGREGQPVQVTVEESVFAENFSAQGAGLYIGRYAEGEVNRCSFRDNLSYHSGGGAYKGGFAEGNLGETAVFRYCEFVGNRAGLDLEGTPSSYSYGGAFCTRLHPRAFLINCTFLENSANASTARGDAFFMESQGGDFDSDLKRCRLINCLFWDETGQKYQVDTHTTHAFSEVTNCAMIEGDFQAPEVTPTAMVWLTESPCTGPDDPHLPSGSPCIDAGVLTGDTMDFAGSEVPHGGGQDIGAYEYTTDVSVEDPEDDEVPPSLAAAGVLLPPYPNPFNPSTNLRFRLAEPGRVTLAVYDLSGRRVRTLLDGAAMSVGHHALTWDGRDESRRALPSGVYFLRMRAGETQSRCRLLLNR